MTNTPESLHRKGMLRLFFSLFISSIGSAATLRCEIKANLSTIYKNTIETKPNEKILVGRISEITAYVNERSQNHYEVEGFLADQEARIYAEGPLKERSDHVTASFWNRERLVNISCTPESL